MKLIRYYGSFITKNLDTLKIYQKCSNCKHYTFDKDNDHNYDLSKCSKFVNPDKSLKYTDECRNDKGLCGYLGNHYMDKSKNNIQTVYIKCIC